MHFNPRSREGSDYFPLYTFFLPPLFQSTLPRRERLLQSRKHGNYTTISIHAPAKGATCDGVDNVIHDIISIHAPAKGATAVRELSIAIQLHFNPRSREGSDIMAEVKEAGLKLFQSTLPRRERLIQNSPKTNKIKFQSTLPRRERRETTKLCEILWHFNPRSREGSDIQGMDGRQKQNISIHAPAKGATRIFPVLFE